MLGDKKIVALVPITDAARAKAFYSEKLGLRFVSEDPFALVFDANGNMLRLTKMKEFTPQRFSILGWEVADIEAAVRQLTAAGVTFERYGFFKQDELGIWTAPDGTKVAWFLDPDGNNLGISQHGSLAEA
jgi:catechol 2,3-dioxygenase-like lactoylglutathione lyase family enzyme